MRICIASADVLGPVPNGGVDTPFAGLAGLLVRAGHDVTVLYDSECCGTGFGAQSLADHADAGVTLVPLRRHNKTPILFQGDAADAVDVVRSYDVYEYLREQTFDVVHFADHLGIGFYACMAKRTGSACPKTLLCVTAVGPTLWSRTANLAAIDHISLLYRDALERGSVAHADHVVTPNRYLGGWLTQNQWRVAPWQSTIPGLRPPRDGGNGSVVADTGRMQVDEVVFFGPLEPRKGIFVFFDAIDRLNHQLKRVTFVGTSPESTSFSKRVLGLRAQKWEFEWQVLDDLTTREALDYLSSGKRLAVLPSLCDSSPQALLECMARHIPVIAADVGGIPEMVAEEDHARCLVPPTCADLAAAIETALRHGAHAPRPAGNVEDAPGRWLRLHDEFRGRLEGEPTRPSAQALASPALASQAPCFSVCILHRNRPGYLSQALDGLHGQTMRDFEIIIADNGSDTDEALSYLDELCQWKGEPPIRVLRLGENRFPAGGRNAAAANASGKYIKFLDDDNVPKQRELAAFGTALDSGSFDVVTCSLDFFDSDVPPAPEDDPDARFLWLGDGASASYLYNVLGDANFAMRRDKFEELGGFDDDGFLYHAEDWRFLCKAKARGLRIGTIPDGLVWYRRDRYVARSNWRKSDIWGARYRAMSELSAGMPTEARNMMLLAKGLLFRHKAKP